MLNYYHSQESKTQSWKTVAHLIDLLKPFQLILSDELFDLSSIVHEQTIVQIPQPDYYTETCKTRL